MTDFSSKSALVVDTGGANVATALRLARDFGKVYYCTNFHRGFDRLAEAAPGMGFDEIEWITNQFEYRPDLYVYPDCSHADEQEFLVQSGARVWGSRHGSDLENKRRFFLSNVKEVGLQVPQYTVIEGLSELKRHLQNSGECFIKCSYWRGSCETHHHISMDLSASWFVHLEKELGGLKEQVPFIVLEPVDAVTEIGYDGYCIDGQFPAQSMQGIEGKDKTYIGAVTDYQDLPEQVRQVNEAFGPVLKDYRYRNRWSTEIRITENDGFFFIDPTCRMPSPAGESQLANEENTGEIYWEGASGNLVQPKYRKLFAVQVVIEHDEEMCEWRPLLVPEEIKDRVFLKYPCRVGDAYWIPPQQHDGIIGWIVGIGDTIQTAIEEVKTVAGLLENQSLKINTDSLVDSLKAVEQQEESGIPFTEEPVPEPESVIEK